MRDEYTVENKRLRKVTRHMWRICLGAWQLEATREEVQNTFKKRSRFTWKTCGSTANPYRIRKREAQCSRSQQVKRFCIEYAGTGPPFGQLFYSHI